MRSLPDLRLVRLVEQFGFLKRGHSTYSMSLVDKVSSRREPFEFAAVGGGATSQKSTARAQADCQTSEVKTKQNTEVKATGERE